MLSVVTIVKNRNLQLSNLYQSLQTSVDCDGQTLPLHFIVVDMSGEARFIDFPETHSIKKYTYVSLEKHPSLSHSSMPLAMARNRGASLACSESIVFLDVDCIVAPTTVYELTDKLTKDTVLMATPRYLPMLPYHGNFKTLYPLAEPHPSREQCKGQCEARHFWSLAFSIDRSSFSGVNGFDEAFVGYGAEDTDFAYKLNVQGIKFHLLDTPVLHQYHTKVDPPLNYFKDIIKNAETFQSKWGEYPMMRWLDKFAELGLINSEYRTQSIIIQSEPNQDMIDACFSTTPY